MNEKSKFSNFMGHYSTAAIRFISVRFAEIPNNVKQVDITPQITSLYNDNFPAHFPKLETYCFQKKTTQPAANKVKHRNSAMSFGRYTTKLKVVVMLPTFTTLCHFGVVYSRAILGYGGFR